MAFSRILNLLGAVMVLAACGGGSRPKGAEATTAGPPQAAPTLAAVDSRPVIVAFGDSLTAGFGADPEQSYPAHLQRELDRRGLAWRVVNEGLSGDTTSGGLSRVASVLAHKPAIVILELGGNDGLRGLPVSVTRSNLESMIVELQQAGARVLLAGITLPPNYGPEYIRPFEQNYKDLARKYRLPFIPFLLEGVATNRHLMQGDGIHPTAEGNRQVALTVLKTLEPMLRAR